MKCLEWIRLYEAFEAFEARAKRSGYRVKELEAIGDDLFGSCPIPQPRPTKEPGRESMTQGRNAT